MSEKVIDENDSTSEYNGFFEPIQRKRYDISMTVTFSEDIPFEEASKRIFTALRSAGVIGTKGGVR